ncbi:hypothetical protein I317_01493 [Kwoniella heveanensis CBS 569]|nr:hypothetical protein I317_01493 [Kwoniella heveanensis CBS 569]
MSSSAYQPIPTSSPPSSRPTSPQYQSRTSTHTPLHETDPSYRPLRRSVQDEFNRPAPSWWKRVLLVIALFAMGWISIKLGSQGWGSGTKDGDKPTIIYASRYSDEHKYRPAASPVITEYLPGNRIRLRGASIGGVGIKEEDKPLTPKQKLKKEQERREEARNKAREKMGLRVKKKNTLEGMKEKEKDKVRELGRKMRGEV